MYFLAYISFLFGEEKLDALIAVKKSIFLVKNNKKFDIVVFFIKIGNYSLNNFLIRNLSFSNYLQLSTMFSSHYVTSEAL